MTGLFKRLLKKRALDEKFLNPEYEELSSPFLLLDMELAVERIIAAAKKGEKVLIYGDYDVDGVTASAVMREALLAIGVKEIEILLPDRFTEGYGMNMGAVAKIKKMGVGLVVTVDCGSNSGEVVAALKVEGIDCVITDHHEISEIASEAVAVVNPKRGEVAKDLAGVGVAFKLAQALRERFFGKCDGQEKWLLDLVAIGTIADSMPLLGENRILVYWGMKVLAKTRRLGLKELMKLAGVKVGDLTTQSIGFQIGPRLNASGRMTSAQKALDLVLADTKVRAFKLAQELEELNLERRKTQQVIIKEAMSQVEDKDTVVAVEGDWHEGVIGIVAGRLTEQLKRPSFVFSRVEGDLLKGSGRSFGDFSLADCITECKEILVTGGGHDYACGVKIAKNDFEKFKEKTNKYYKSLKLKDQARFLRRAVDIEIGDLSELSLEFWGDLLKLEPFGEGNPEPVFRLKNMKVVNVRKMGDEGQHLKLEVEDEKGSTISLVAFFADEKWMQVALGENLKIDASLMLNEWRGIKTVEGRILAIEQDADI